MVRNTAKLLGKLKILDYNRVYGIESENLQDVTTSTSGTHYHLSFKYFLTTYFRIVFQNKIYSEPYLLKPLSSDHPDFLIILNKMDRNFQAFFRDEFDKMNSSLVNFRDYEYIIVDFTTYISTSNIRNKIEKYFPPGNVLFLIVGIGLKKDILHSYKNILIPYNIKIISPRFFCKLIQLNLPENYNYLDSFNIILRNAIKRDIEGLKEINKSIKTDLYSTDELKRDLGIKDLSKIFNVVDTVAEFSKIYFKNLIKEIKTYGIVLDVPSECIDTAKSVIIKAMKLGIIGINYDPLGYVGVALYLSSRFLLQKNTITQEFICDKLKISTTPIKDRIVNINQYDEIVLDVLFEASINQILGILKIKSLQCKKLAIKLIRLVYRKIYKIQEKERAHKEPVVISASAIYLAVNHLGITLSQKEVGNVIGFSPSAIYNTLVEFKVIKADFEKLNIELVDPIGKKKLEKSKILDIQIVNILNEYGKLTTKQVLIKLSEGSTTERTLFDHLDIMADQGILKKELVQNGSSLQAKWKIKDFADKILETLDKEGGLSMTQLLSKLKTDKLDKGSMEYHLNRLVEDGLIKVEKALWELVRPKNIDELIIELLKDKGKLNTLQLISELEQFSPNTLRPHLNNLAKMGVIKKFQMRIGKNTINIWEY